MKRLSIILLSLVMLVSLLPQAVMAQYTMIFEDDFEAQLYTDAYETVNKAFPTTASGGGVWIARGATAGRLHKVGKANSGNSLGVDNIVAEVHSQYSSSANEWNYLETPATNFSSYNDVTFQVTVKAPSNNLHNIVITGVDFRNADDTGTVNAAAFARFGSSGSSKNILVSDGGAGDSPATSTGIPYTDDNWYDVTVKIVKGINSNPDTYKITIQNKAVGNDRYESAEIPITGYKLFSTTAGKFRVTAHTRQDATGGWGITKFDDVKIYTGEYVDTPVFSVIKTSPETGATGLASDMGMSIKCSSPINSATINGNITINKGAVIIPVVNPNDPTELLISFSGLMDSTEYTVTLATGFEGTNGAGLFEAKTVIFTTRAPNFNRILLEESFQDAGWTDSFVRRVSGADGTEILYTEDNKNAHAAGNKTLEVLNKLTGTNPQHNIQSKNSYDLTDATKLTMSFMLRAPESRGADSERVDAMLLNDTTGPVFFRFHNGNIYLCNVITPSAVYRNMGAFAASRWYKITVVFDKLESSTTMSSTITDTVDSAKSFTDTATLAGYDPFSYNKAIPRFAIYKLANSPATASYRIDDFSMSAEYAPSESMEAEIGAVQIYENNVNVTRGGLRPGNLKITVPIKSIASSYQDSPIILGKYKAGVLTGCEVKATGAMTNNYNGISFDVSITDETQLKVFVFDSSDDIKPLCEVACIE